MARNAGSSQIRSARAPKRKGGGADRSAAPPAPARDQDDEVSTDGLEDDGAIEAQFVADDTAGEGGADLQVATAEARQSGDALSRYDPLRAYLSEVARHPLLSHEEANALAERYQKTTDVTAAAHLVTANLRLVVKIAYEYRRAYRNLMDIIQEGNIGLMQAVKRFDPYRGVKLSTYAAWWIRAYILRFILNNWRLVKLSTTQTQRKLFFNLNREKQRLHSLGVDPTSAELAASLDVAEHEVIEMDRRLSGNDLSLDAPVGDSDGRPTSRMDLMVSGDASIDETLASEELGGMVRDRLRAFEKTLSGKDVAIFRERLVADEPATLQDIGDRYGISRERVRQIEKRLQDRLRVFLASELGEAIEFD